ncbi:loricrin-related, partial [Striga asiatica]
MDGTPDYTITMAHMSEHWAKLDFPTVTPLEFNLHGVPIPFTPNKRTCITRNPPFNNDGSALVFGLGLSSNSCTTMCLGRENEEDSSIDLNLSINFNADDKKPSDPKFPIGNLNATNKRKPVLDLELSLSTANAESDATTIPDKNPSEDEGSTPSHSKSVPKRGKRCEFPGGCGKGAEGSTPFCKAHGGGKRCAFPEGCGRSVHGGTAFCVGHGGGKRCAENGCTKSARGKTSHCVRHGGGRRCAFPGGCGKSAQGRTDRCKAHGGGKLGLYAAQVRGKDDEESTSVVRVEFDAKGNNNDVVLGDGGLEEYSLPEGRVHGGGLMAMLRGGAACGREGNRYK